MKKTLLLAVATLCGTVMSANAAYTLDDIEKAAWTNLSNTTDFANNNYTGEWGRLKLVGNQLCSENGDPIQLRGWSTYSINYDDVVPCLNEDGFDAMKAWGANIVRLAVYPNNSKGSYDASTDTLIEKYIGYASARKMYVLVDWHVSDMDSSNSGDPVTYKAQAIQMFTNITKYCKDNGYSNVLYEICNECSGVTWNEIKSYANEVLPVIEAGDPGAIVIVGTPQWDQNIQEAVSDPIEKDSFPNLGLMYAFHFSACSHMYLVGNMQSATASLPVFISEWSSVAFDRTGGFCESNSTYFLSHLRPAGNNGGQLVSWCYASWGQNNKYYNSLEDCTTGYNGSVLSTSGTYIVGILTGKDNIPCPGCGFDPYPYYQDIPYMSNLDWGVLNVGWFDQGGQYVSYYDTNSSMYSDADHTIIDTTGVEYLFPNYGAYASCNGDTSKYEKMFRYNEDVDVSNFCAGLGGNWGDPGDGMSTQASDLHHLCKTEHGEWIVYTINVLKAGYYTVKCMTNNNTNPKGTIGMSIVKGSGSNQNGNIIRSWKDHADVEKLAENPWFSFALNPTPTCGLMYDGTIDKNGATNGDKSRDWTCWGWTDCGATDADKEDLTVLFKYTGEQKLMISISPDVKESPGDFSNFAFTLKSEEIPDQEWSTVENETAELSNVYLTPNPTSGAFTVKVNSAANVAVYDAVGVKVYNKDIEGDVTINNNFAPGVYTVIVKTTLGKNIQKLIVK